MNGTYPLNCAIKKKGLTRRSALYRLSAVALGAPYIIRGAHAEEETLNWLTWAGSADPYIVGEFEKSTGIKIKGKDYADGDFAIAELSQNPGLYDLVTPSLDVTPQLVDADLLLPLDPKKYGSWKDYFPEFQGSLGVEPEGNLHCIVTEFGFNAFAYRTDKLSAEDVANYDILMNPKVKGKVGLMDWWGNTMGALSIAAGNSPVKGINPYRIDNAQFKSLVDYMGALRPQVAGFYPQAAIFSAFANGTIWIQPGGGDWAVQILKDQGVPVASAIPSEGAYLWGSGISIVKSTKRQQAAEKFVEYLMSPHAQARIATKASYSALVPNMKAWQVVQEEKPDWAKRLGMDSLTGNNAMLPMKQGKIAPRLLPVDQTPDQWAQAWQAFKAS